MKKSTRWSTFLAAALAATAMAQAAPMVTNGGFESGDFAGWSLFEAEGLNTVAADFQRSGGFSAFFGEPHTPGVISQTLATDIGRQYSVSFWLANLGGSFANADTVNAFAMLLDGNQVIGVQDKAATDYTRYEWTFTAASGYTTLAFSFQHDESFWLLDDVAVNAIPTTIPAVPEPSAALLLMLGLGALALRSRTR